MECGLGSGVDGDDGVDPVRALVDRNVRPGMSLNSQIDGGRGLGVAWDSWKDVSERGERAVLYTTSIARGGQPNEHRDTTRRARPWALHARSNRRRRDAVVSAKQSSYTRQE